MYIFGTFTIDTFGTGENSLHEWEVCCELPSEKYNKVAALLDRIIDIINDEPSEVRKLRCVKPTTEHPL